MGEWPKPRGACARAHSPYQKFMSGGDCLMAVAAAAAPPQVKTFQPQEAEVPKE